MAEMLVRTVDKVNAQDVYLDCKCTKRGMVIAICPDGWQWSQAEKTAPYWTIIKVPGVSVDDLSGYLAPEPGDPKLNRMLQRRAFRFDLIAYALSAKSTISTLDAQAMKVPVTPLPDPSVL